MQSPNAQQLTALWVVADDDVYAAGADGTVLHYDGTTWNQLPQPNTANNIVGIWANPAGDVVAIALDGLAFRLAGAAWTTITPMPQVRLNGLWGSRIEFLIAVGSLDSASQGTIQRYDGSAWSPMMSNTGVQLFATWGSNETNVVAVGASGTIHRYDGSMWSAVPGAPGIGANLRAEWTSDATIFAAGFVGLAGTVWQQQGSTFVAESLPNAQPLESVWGGADNDVYAVAQGGAIFHYDGATWSAMASPTQSSLLAVRGTATSVFAVGDAGTILRYSVP
jgi:hypothetical protein